MTNTLSPRQSETLSFIGFFRRTFGYSPTMQEIADRMGVSKVTVHGQINVLERRGFVRRDKHKARSLEVVRTLLPESPKNFGLTVLGEISAGLPLASIPQSENVDLGTIFAAKTGVFVLRVKDDSMLADHTCAGDFIVIDRRDSAKSGEKVVGVMKTGAAIVARYYRERGGLVRLQSANAAILPVFVKDHDLRIQGVVIGVMRACGGAS